MLYHRGRVLNGVDRSIQRLPFFIPAFDNRHSRSYNPTTVFLQLLLAALA